MGVLGVVKYSQSGERQMKKNIGIPDRLLRLAFALALFLFAYWQSSWISFGFGVFTLYEVCASWCVLYQLLGKSTCPIKRDK